MSISPLDPSYSYIDQSEINKVSEKDGVLINKDTPLDSYEPSNNDIGNNLNQIENTTNEQYDKYVSEDNLGYENIEENNYYDQYESETDNRVLNNKTQFIILSSLAGGLAFGASIIAALSGKKIKELNNLANSFSKAVDDSKKAKIKDQFDKKNNWLGTIGNWFNKKVNKKNIKTIKEYKKTTQGQLEFKSDVKNLENNKNELNEIQNKNSQSQIENEKFKKNEIIKKFSENEENLNNQIAKMEGEENKELKENLKNLLNACHKQNDETNTQSFEGEDLYNLIIAKKGIDQNIGSIDNKDNLENTVKKVYEDKINNFIKFVSQIKPEDVTENDITRILDYRKELQKINNTNENKKVISQICNYFRNTFKSQNVQKDVMITRLCDAIDDKIYEIIDNSLKNIPQMKLNRPTSKIVKDPSIKDIETIKNSLKIIQIINQSDKSLDAKTKKQIKNLEDVAGKYLYICLNKIKNKLNNFESDQNYGEIFRLFSMIKEINEVNETNINNILNEIKAEITSPCQEVLNNIIDKLNVDVSISDNNPTTINNIIEAFDNINKKLLKSINDSTPPIKQDHNISILQSIDINKFKNNDSINLENNNNFRDFNVIKNDNLVYYESKNNQNISYLIYDEQNNSSSRFARIIKPNDETVQYVLESNQHQFIYDEYGHLLSIYEKNYCNQPILKSHENGLYDIRYKDKNNDENIISVPPEALSDNLRYITDKTVQLKENKPSLYKKIMLYIKNNTEKTNPSLSSKVSYEEETTWHNIFELRDKQKNQATNLIDNI